VTVTEHPRAVVRMIGITMLNTLCYYTFFAALIPFAANSRHADPRDVFLASSLGTAVFIALQYPFGALSDRIGRRPQMLVWCAALAALTVPLSALVKPGLASLAVVFCVGLGLYSVFSSIAPAVMSELFPTELRGVGIGAWYNLTVATFGGTAPLVISALAMAGHDTAFFYYVSAGAVIALLVVLSLPETTRSKLR
jgi:MHS family alpha-ketoglutarate permease-like MFS transporter